MLLVTCYLLPCLFPVLKKYRLLNTILLKKLYLCSQKEIIES